LANNDERDTRMDLTRAILTDHGRDQLTARAIDEAEIRRVLAEYESADELRRGRVVAQAVLPSGDPPGDHLLRVFVDVDRDPPEIVTAYRTSKISKYRSRP
jgi:hypothetical protein